MTTLLAWLADVRWHGLLELIPGVWALLRGLHVFKCYRRGEALSTGVSGGQADF